ncbi:MAG: hypothetical protein OEQ53_14075, partial [Saprospiraceae bacterium]|nr:hypothetical protein [Saprospiraceae bacterium]
NFTPNDFPYRKTISLGLDGEPLPHKIIHRRSRSISVAQGNHRVTGIDLGEEILSHHIEVLHFPIRSYKQFCSKVSNGGSGYELNHTLKPRTGYHKRRWYNLLKEGSLEQEFDRLYYPSEKLKKSLEEGILLEDRILENYKPWKK